MRDWDHADSRDVEQPPGNGLVLPRRLLDELGPLDERFFIFYVDVDLCQRLETAGYRRHFLAGARIVHHLGQSTGQLPSFPLVLQTDRVRWYRKRYGVLGGLYIKAVASSIALDHLLRRTWPFEPGRLWAETRAVSRNLARLLATRA